MLKNIKDVGDEWEVTFATANGEKDTRRYIEFDVRGLANPRIQPYVMDDSPDLLSIGSRCELEGYGFYWPPYGQTPCFCHGACSMAIKLVLWP